MEIVVVLILLGFAAVLIWLLTTNKRAATTRQPVRVARVPEKKPSFIPTTPTTTPTEAVRAKSAKEFWIPPGDEVTVAGYTIPDGMLYVGKGLQSVAGYGIEPALIDPSLRVDHSNPNRTGEGMTYWPSYSSISPSCRAAYLEWLATGRRDPTAYIGYVFLFFYGLERRGLAEARLSDRAKQDVATILHEVEQLLEVYGSNSSFRGYAIQLVDVFKTTSSANGEIEPPMERVGYELPLSLRAGIGHFIADGKPIPADWALSWFLTHPETYLLTPAKRCPKEFSALFHTRYTREFGEGLVLKPNKSALRMTLRPASASFGGQVELSMNLPDIAALTAPVSKLRQIGESCEADLDAFSRWVGRNAAAPRILAGVALLPPELAATHGSEEAQALWAWFETTLGANDRTICPSDDLLRYCRSFGEGKLAKSEAVLLAQLLERQGYGIEPDVRFGGVPLGPGEVVVIFRLPQGAAAIASPQYAAATVLLNLAVAVAASDGSISDAELRLFEQYKQDALALSVAERIRLSAHLSWLLEARPNVSGLKKRLESLDLQQRSAIAEFVIGAAGADGQISPNEIRTLGKIYPMLGLTADDVYSHVHAMAIGGTIAQDNGEPLTIVPSQPSTGYAIPPRPDFASTVRLNMDAVNSKLAESARISAILGDIFAEDDPGSIPAPAPTAYGGKVPPSHGVLLSRLTERSEWSRTEFDRIVAECRLLPDGAIDALNEAAFEHVGGPVLEGSDPIHVDASAAQALLT